MSLRTAKRNQAGRADISFKGDPNTGIVSTSNNHIGIMSAGQQVCAHGTDGDGVVHRMTQTRRVPLVAGAGGGGGVFSWQNPMGSAIIIEDVELDITTPTSGACTVDVGVAATGTTSSDTLIDDGNMAGSAKVLNTRKHMGTNGIGPQRCAAGAFVTGSVASGSSAGLVGFAHITFRLV